jgi:hypothetical protein
MRALYDFLNGLRAAPAGHLIVSGLRHSHAIALCKTRSQSKGPVARRLAHSRISVTVDINSAALPNTRRAGVEQLVASTCAS